MDQKLPDATRSRTLTMGRGHGQWLVGRRVLSSVRLSPRVGTVMPTAGSSRYVYVRVLTAMVEFLGMAPRFHAPVPRTCDGDE